MAASYPSSIAVIATVNNTDVSDASQVNVPSAEIVAVETGLLNGFQHDILPLTNIGKSVGSTSKRWLKLWGQDCDLSGTLTLTTGLGVASGGTGATTLTAHGVLLGEGTSAIAATGAGTAAQVLTSNGAAADPTFQAIPAGTVTLLKANTGTDTSAGATNVDTIALTGLTAKDTLLIYYSAISVTQATADLALYSTTDSQLLAGAMCGSIAAGEVVSFDCKVLQSQASTTSYWTFKVGGGSVAGAKGPLPVISPAMTTAWTGSWTLALRHGGVTAGGTLQWKWSVYKVAGQ